MVPKVLEFHDILHGTIRLGLPFNTRLLQDLLNTPEVERLRNMRLMNFDVPLIQELGSAKRLPHSIGVCHLAQELGKRSLIAKEELSTLMVAALLHDAAIPPYGHLVESILRRKHPDFDHEKLLKHLLFGTYHSANDYHQIVPSRSLMVRRTLDKHGIDPERVLALVQPKKTYGSAISAQIDLDNIDNVHRMACLMGWHGAKSNLREIARNIRISNRFCIEFNAEALSALEVWLDFRQRLYTLVIAHPSCVAYNAFQSDLVRQAIEAEIIDPDTWYITEPEFEERLRRNPATKDFGNQLIAGSRYRLIDYVWFTSVGDPPCENWMTIDEVVKSRLSDLGKRETYFSWVESGLISRQVDARMNDGRTTRVGLRSTSCLIARIHTESESFNPPELTQEERSLWRSEVQEVFMQCVGGWQGDTLFPEDYVGSYFRLDDHVGQLELC